MRLFTYIGYFYFLLVNWDLRIAWYLVKQEVRGEKKYAINTTGADELHQLNKMGIDISHATIYMPVSYFLLEEIFQQLPASPRNHFLDIGSGKGRALCVAAHHGFGQLTGIDFSKTLCELAIENLQKTREIIPSFQFTIINNDAFYYEIPENTDCIFLFNPFDEIIMSAVVQNISKSLDKHPRMLSIVYVNPLHKEYFIKAGFRETWYSKKMKHIEVVILQNK